MQTIFKLYSKDIEDIHKDYDFFQSVAILIVFISFAIFGIICAFVDLGELISRVTS